MYINLSVGVGEGGRWSVTADQTWRGDEAGTYTFDKALFLPTFWFRCFLFLFFVLRCEAGAGAADVDASGSKVVDDGPAGSTSIEATNPATPAGDLFG